MAEPVTIQDSFDMDEIREADVFLSTAEQDMLDAVLRELWESGGDDIKAEDAVNLASLAFVAGRCFQQQYAGVVKVPMDQTMLMAFLNYLAGER